MKENNTVRQYKTALIIVSILLIAALLAQGIYWARANKGSGQVAQSGQTENTAPPEQAEQSGQVGQQEQTAQPAQTEQPAQAEVSPGSLSREGYTLEQVVVMSRHNIRSPLSGNGTVLGKVTPHEWFEWSSNPSELSLRGGAMETLIGQYFRKWLEAEGLFPENYHPGQDAVRFYSNSKQRTIATAQYFMSGLLPTANMQVEYAVEFDTMDPVFTPKTNFVTEEYTEDVKAQIEELHGDKIRALEDNYELIADVIDFEESEAYKSGEITGFSTDDTEIILEADEEPKMKGSLRTACSISDALVLQYYEEPDVEKAAFGHTLTREQWKEISEVKDLYNDILFATPLLAYNVEHQILQEIRSELTAEGREFTFLCGHDSNLAGIVSCLRAAKYSLPETIENTTPIGGKIVFCRWRAKDGEELISVDLVYSSAEQLRDLTLMDLNTPPYVIPLALEGLEQVADGLYKAEDVLGRLDEALGEYDKLLEKYGVEEKEPEIIEMPVPEEEEELDQAA